MLMLATLTHRSGEMTQLARVSDIEALVAELDEPDDPDHPDIAVTVDWGWTLSAFPTGLLIWEDVDGDGFACHRTSVSRDEVVALFSALVRGDRATIERAEWAPGYRPESRDSPTP